MRKVNISNTLLFLLSMFFISPQIYAVQPVKNHTDSSYDALWRAELSELEDAKEIYELFGGLLFLGNFELAHDYLQKAAELGHLQAQLDLGYRYYAGPQGKYVVEHDIFVYKGAGQPNYIHAFHWYKKAAKQGSDVAQYMLGSMYREGKGVDQNDSNAVYWIRKAAEQGLADAQHDLGIMFYFGLGVDKSYARATDWLRKSANQGEYLSIKALDELHLN